jgi:NADPH-dependent curcumin reductase CurA
MGWGDRSQNHLYLLPLSIVLPLDTSHHHTITHLIKPATTPSQSQKKQGFIVTTIADAALSADFARDMARWTRDGTVKASETVYKGGVGALPGAFRSMLGGGNMGKAVVAISAEDPYPCSG